MAYNIFRPLSSEEKVGVKELRRGRNPDILDVFLADLADKQQFYQKQYRPFDTYGARMDFESEVQSKLTEVQRAADPNKVDTSIDFGDFGKYADPKRFKFVKKTEVAALRLVAGIKEEVHIGQRYHFVTKKRGNRLSIYVPNTDVEKVDKWVKETFKEDLEEVEESRSVVNEVVKK